MTVISLHGLLLHGVDFIVPFWFNVFTNSLESNRHGKEHMCWGMCQDVGINARCAPNYYIRVSLPQLSPGLNRLCGLKF